MSPQKLTQTTFATLLDSIKVGYVAPFDGPLLRCCNQTQESVSNDDSFLLSSPCDEQTDPHHRPCPLIRQPRGERLSWGPCLERHTPQPRSMIPPASLVFFPPSHRLPPTTLSDAIAIVIAGSSSPAILKPPVVDARGQSELPQSPPCFL